jgi:hypothetical protein
VTDEQAAGDRASWPWLPASIVSQVGADEWSVVIEDVRATSMEVQADENTRMYPIVFRNASEIRPAR